MLLVVKLELDTPPTTMWACFWRSISLRYCLSSMPTSSAIFSSGSASASVPDNDVDSPGHSTGHEHASYWLVSLNTVKLRYNVFWGPINRYVICEVAVWRKWRWSDQWSYSTLGPVSTGMGDRIWIQLLVRVIPTTIANSAIHPLEGR